MTHAALPVKKITNIPYVTGTKHMSDSRTRTRSNLSKPAARQRYLEIGELVVLEQIRRDAEQLDKSAIAVGPFARLQADAVADRDQKTRGAISNLFGSQAAFQAETMELVLNAGDWIAAFTYPDPHDYVEANAWVDAFLVSQSERGPCHGATPEVSYASVWALWLSAVPYGLWSRQISQSSLNELDLWLQQLLLLFQKAITHFRLRMRPGAKLEDLACGMAGFIEGLWLHQCLTLQHPFSIEEPISTVARRAGLMLWQGATEPDHDVS
jgi:hypothetical protein